MKQQLKHKAWSLCIPLILTLACLTPRGRSAQSPHDAGHVVLPDTTSSSSEPSISALQVFRDAYENRYTWNKQFPGFTAVLELNIDTKTYRGRVRINPNNSGKITGIEDKKARQAVENTLGMLIVHRRKAPFEVEHKNSTFQLGTTDKNGAVEIFEHGDKTESHYKVFHKQLTQVNRVLGQTAVTVNVLSSEMTPEGYLATRYRTIYRDPKTNRVMGEEEEKDTYQKIGGYYLVTNQIVQDFEEGRLTNTTQFHFTSIKLLSNND